MANINDYLALIPPPHCNKPNFMAWVAAVIQPAVDTLNFTQSLADSFNLNNAVGPQLDILGVVLGRSRVLTFQPSTASPILDDPTYRLVLKAKVLQNMWNGTVNELYDFFQANIPYPITIQDNQDMTMNVLVIGMPTGLLRELVSNGYFVPKPAGVRVNYSFTTTAFFGYDSNTGFVHGYDDGVWA